MERRTDGRTDTPSFRDATAHLIRKMGRKKREKNLLRIAPEHGMDSFDSVSDGGGGNVRRPSFMPHFLEQFLVGFGQHGLDFGGRECIAVEEKVREWRAVGQRLERRVHVTRVAQILKPCEVKK